MPNGAKESTLIQIAMPLLADRDTPEPKKVVAAWRELFPEQPPLRLLVGAAVAHFEVEGAAIMAAHMPVPVPTEEVLDAVRRSWMWQWPDDAVRGHQTHVIVTAVPGGDPVREAFLVARLSAAVLRAGRGTALYWGASSQVHLPEVVVELAANYEPFPVPLCVGITISGASGSGPFSAATHGLEALGHKEFEVLGTRMRIGDLRSSLLDAAAYVLESGPVLLDGHTFGFSAEQKWPVRHAPSELVRDRQAIVLDIP